MRQNGMRDQILALKAEGFGDQIRLIIDLPAFCEVKVFMRQFEIIAVLKSRKERMFTESMQIDH